MRVPSSRPRLGRPKPSDVSAGLVTGLFSIPEGMAYAAIGGFHPVTGIYAGVVPTILGSLFARTVLMVTTLTSALALTSRSVVSEAGLDAGDAGTVAALAVLSGLVMLVLGLLRLGVLMSFVSNAVMTGFSTGIALQIITGSLADATGWSPAGHNKLVQLGDWLAHPYDWDPATTLTAAATVAVWALVRRWRRARPVAVLAALLVVSVAVGLLGTDVRLVQDIADVPAALPPFTLPDPSVAGALLPGACAVALVGLAQAASIGPTVPNPDGTRSSVDGDFVAQGVSGIGGGLFGALPTGGSLSRTGVAVGAGARTRWAGIFAGVWLALLVLTLGSLAERIPMPVIGALIIVIGCELIAGRVPDLVLVVRTSWLSALAMAVTFLATTQLPLQRAIVLGAVLSLLLYCGQAARQSGLRALVPDRPDRHDGPAGPGWRVAPPPPRIAPGTVTVLHYDGTSLFAEAPRIDEQWPDTRHARGSAVVLGLRGVPEVPSSAVLKLLRRYARELRAHGGRLYLAGVEPRLLDVLGRTGVLSELGPDAVVPVTPTVFGAQREAVGRAERWVAEHRGPPVT